MSTQERDTVELERRVAELQRDKEALLDKLEAERIRREALEWALEMLPEVKGRQGLLDRALEGAIELTGAEAGSILMASREDPSLLKFESARGERAEELRGFALRRGEGVAGWVVDHGVAQIVPEAGKDERFLASLANQIGYSVRNILCVPLRKAGEVAGALELLNKGGGRNFNALDVEVAEVFASQAGRLLQIAEDLGAAGE